MQAKVPSFGIPLSGFWIQITFNSEGTWISYCYFTNIWINLLHYSHQEILFKWLLLFKCFQCSQIKAPGITSRQVSNPFIMQEQKLKSQSAKAKKHMLPSREKNAENVFDERSSQEQPNCRSNRFQRTFFKKEAYTPEYSPGYAAQEKTDQRIPINYLDRTPNGSLMLTQNRSKCLEHTGYPSCRWGS